MNDLLSVVTALLTLALILLAAWGCSRFLGKRWNGMLRTAKHMRIVDQLVVGQDRLLLILRIDQEEDCFLVASSPEGIRILTRLSGDYSGEEEPDPGWKSAFSPQDGFKAYLQNALEAFRRGKDKTHE